MARRVEDEMSHHVEESREGESTIRCEETIRRPLPHLTKRGITGMLMRLLHSSLETPIFGMLADRCSAEEKKSDITTREDVFPVLPQGLLCETVPEHVRFAASDVVLGEAVVRFIDEGQEAVEYPKMFASTTLAKRANRWLISAVRLMRPT